MKSSDARQSTNLDLAFAGEGHAVGLGIEHLPFLKGRSSHGDGLNVARKSLVNRPNLHIFLLTAYAVQQTGLTR